MAKQSNADIESLAINQDEEFTLDTEPATIDYATYKASQYASKESHPQKDLTPGRAKLKSWLNKYLRIVMTDGRVLVGLFYCTDSDSNIILGLCSENIRDENEDHFLGMVMVPGRHIVSMEVDVANDGMGL